MTAPDKSESRTLSDVIVEYLTLLGVEYVFGVPGGHIGGLFEALDRSAQQGGPRAVLARHESGGAFMAAGYARESGKLGVCCGTTNPGTTNLITGVAAADEDQDRVLVLTGQTVLPSFGRGAFQESSPDVLDTTAMLGCCTSYNSLVTHPGQLEPKLLSALLTALRPPFGAAHLSIPADIYRTAWSTPIQYPHLLQLLQAPHALLDLSAVERLGQQIIATRQAGKKCVILVGHNCQGATEAIMALAERLDATLISTHAGKNWLNACHPRYVGVFGFAGHASARAALEDPQTGLIIVAGSRLGQWGTSTWDAALCNRKMVHIHPHPYYFQRALEAQLHVHGEIRAVFEVLLEKLRDVGLPVPAATASAPVVKGEFPPQISVSTTPDIETRTPMHPQILLQRMMRDLPDDTRLVVDAGNCMAWSIHYFFNRQARCCQYSIESASMAWGVGAAVGFAFANRAAPVVCLVGDGSWLMSSQEMSVAVAEKLPVVYIVLNDSSYNMINQNQLQKSSVRIEFPIPLTDFALIAQGLGGYGHVIRNAADWDALDIEEILHRESPTLLDVRIEQAAIAPLGMC